MKPHEILPEPEDDHESIQSKGVDDFNELISDSAIENKSTGHGSTALSGMAIGDASGQVQSVVSSQTTDDIGGTASNSVIVDVPEIASDIDLIEKIWVQKAKQIVNSTEGDPHVQNKQLNRMKVEYIKKRYDKDINLNEAA